MQRAVAAALLSDNPVTILNPGRDGDSRSALRVARSLGAKVEEAGDRVVIRSGMAPWESRLDCGESGLSLRMFTPIASLFDQEFQLTGQGTLGRRPLGMIEQPLSELGVACTTQSGYLPVTVKGPLQGGRARVDASLGSQFLTGLLMALPKAPKDSELSVDRLVSIPYIQLTLRVLDQFQVAVSHRDYQSFRILGGQKYRRSEYRVEGDWSGAAFLMVAAALAGPVRIQGLDPDSSQGDKRIMDVLTRSGAGLKVMPQGIEVRPGPIEAFEFDVTDCPDLAPPLVALASRARGVSVIQGMGRLVHKESNRAQTLAREFQSLGVDIRLEGERLLIRGGLVQGGEVDSHGDHRLAMALAVAGLAARSTVSIEGADCVIKSYPAFFRDLRSLGGRVHE
jgi:3-phosphoshikimate 1-carboxyvinyltransferase